MEEKIPHQINKEIEMARQARLQGLEGRSRVCARRAAAIAIRPFLSARGVTPPLNAIECIEWLARQADLPPRLKEITGHLLMRVDTNYHLPAEVDLIAETLELIKKLSEWIKAAPIHSQPAMEENKTANIAAGNIIVYGTNWCGDCIRAKHFLDANKISYVWIDIDKDQEAEKLVIEVNNGYRSVPTILFSDGSILIEPSNLQLAIKLKI